METTLCKLVLLYLALQLAVCSRDYECVREINPMNIREDDDNILDAVTCSFDVSIDDGSLRPMLYTRALTARFSEPTTAHLAIEDTDVTRAKNLKMTDRTGCAWTPSKVMVTTGGLTAVFQCDPANLKTEKRFRRDVKRSFIVEVLTSAAFGGGTDARVFIVLHGEEGDSKEFNLSGEFEIDSRDNTTIETSNIGWINAITIRHDDSGGGGIFGSGAAWSLLLVQIYEGHRKVGKFFCDCWVQTGELRHRIDNTHPKCKQSTGECGYNGQCINSAKEICRCNNNYAGDYCQTPPCVAGGNSCGNHGSCEMVGATQGCHCRDGYSGPFCFTPPCTTGGGECGSHGNCREYTDRSYCVCSNNYNGTFCTEPPCVVGDTVCGKHGECTNEDSTNQCTCTDGYTGAFCKEAPCTMGDGRCGTHGACRNYGTGNICSCTDRYTGDLCETAPCIDGSDECGDFGKCNTTGSANFCQCESGYSGNRCQISAHTCAMNSTECGEQGDCVRDEDGVRLCNCSNHYTGDHCHIPPCSLDGDECGDHGVCNVNDTAHACDCHDNYSGVTCSVPPCSVDGGECGMHGSCDANSTSSVTNSSAAVCVCEDGYEGVFCDIELTCTATGGQCNGGTCVTEDTSTPYCQCPSTHTGIHCTEKKQEKKLPSSAGYTGISLATILVLCVLGTNVSV